MRKTLISVMVVATIGVLGGTVLKADVVADRSQRAASIPIEVGDHFTIEPPAAQFVHELDEREHREQIRDWAVLSTVARLGATPAQAAAATFEIPPARLPYLDELYTFEYGRGRRAYLGDRVLLFRDDKDPDPVATIGRLADRVRMENGDLPASVEIYVVTDRRNDGLIDVERLPDVRSTELFSAAYGYVEGDGSDAAQLASWLDRTDDLTFVQIDKQGHLKLGGRRFPNTRTLGVTTEDVAALYQAHEKLDAPRVRARAALRRLPLLVQPQIDKLDELGRGGTLTADTARPPLTELADQLSAYVATGGLTEAAVKQSMEPLRQLMRPAQGPGFSLDPQWLPSAENPDHPRFLAALQMFAADPCAELRAVAKDARALVAQEPDDTRRTARAHLAAELVKLDLEQASGALCAQMKRDVGPQLLPIAAKLEHASPASWDVALADYYHQQAQWQALPTTSSRWFSAQTASMVLKFREYDSRTQCARYDGVAGTQVGMTLFYTDLIAKLWESTDFGLSAPVLEVPGFQSAPRTDMATSFAAGMEKTPNTRLWFGPRMNRLSRTRSKDGAVIAFEHRYSRIYAAGSNPERPGVEAEAREDSRRTLGWWDRHFDDVADYEPQYHRQNQIMKWSLVTAALYVDHEASYLRDVGSDRKLDFQGWRQSAGSTLRFHDALPAAHAVIPGRECIPVLSSYSFQSAGADGVIFGGVGGADASDLAKAPLLRPNDPLGARKPYLFEDGNAAASTATRGHPVLAHQDVRFEHAERARKVTPEGPIKLGTPVVRYAAGGRPHEIEIRAGSGDDAIGKLELDANGDHVHVTWSSRKIEAERKSERSIRSLQDADEAAQHGHASEAAAYYEKTISKPSAIDDDARLAIVDIEHGRPVALLTRLKEMAFRSDVLHDAPRGALLAEMAERESPAAANAVETMLEHRGGGDALVARDGHLLATRDIDASAMRHARRIQPTDLSDGKVYIMGSVSAAHDGLPIDTGGTASRWRRVANVTVEELDASVIGALPDRLPDQLHTPMGDFVAPAAKTGAHQGSTSTPNKMYLIRQCDATHQTATTDDDC